MQLTAEDIREFKDLWQKEFDETLTDDEARHEASQLLELYASLARPLTRPQSSEPHEIFPLLP